MINLLTVSPAEQVMEAAEMPAVETTVNQTSENLSISFWELFSNGGWLMWVLVALAAVMIFIFVERFIAIR